MTFDQLGLSAPILRAVAEAGYDAPTPIQRDAIPPALRGRDILGCAQTGTGKTAAFCLPLLQRVDARADDDPKIRALVVTPTRELAAQIGASIETYGKHLEDLWHTVIFGGVKERPQIQELRQGIDVLVATPGRLLDLMNRGFLTLAHVETFVLDEADQMLDLGFLPDVRRIVAALPRERQTLFFSATMPAPIRELAETLLRDPVAVAVAPVSAPAERVDQHLYFVDKRNKPRLLAELVQQRALDRVLVFCRTKHGANRVAQFLSKRGVEAAAIHGNKSQGARTRALEGFKSGDVRVLVATDIAARGIDVDAVSHVINLDLPNVPETYVHRIGRTARAGASGVALSFCDVEERPYLVDIERLIGAHLQRVEDHAYPATEALPAMTALSGRGRAPTSPRAASARRGGGGGGGGRRRGGRGRAGGGRTGGGRAGGGRTGGGRQGGRR
ncbi:MAG: DEAD/DEAH box helicase [Myxococcales bacterium]|nr:DEAD/DEAH box helicase [Myxococcales bacterium]